MGMWRVINNIFLFKRNILKIEIICFSNYGGGGTREFQIFSKIKLKDDWDLCLNDTLAEIKSKSDEVTHYFPLEQQKSVRFVQIRTQSVYTAKNGFSGGGLQYFSENNIGTTGASYQGKSGLATLLLCNRVDHSRSEIIVCIYCSRPMGVHDSTQHVIPVLSQFVLWI